MRNNKEITPSLPTSSPSLDTTQVAQQLPPQYSPPEQIRRVQMVCPKSKPGTELFGLGRDFLKECSRRTLRMGLNTT